MKLVFNPFTGKLDYVDVKDHHSGKNQVKDGSILCIKKDKEMRVTYINIDGTLKLDGTLVID